MKPITEFLSTKVAKPSIIKATDDTIHQIVKDGLDRLGHDADLNYIDVSNVTDMSFVFCARTLTRKCLGFEYDDINPDVSKWGVGKVENMSFMFAQCKNFNQDISSWDVSKVKNMSNMFYKCENFNQDLSSWEVSKVENMDGMFWSCKNFNQDLSSWDVKNVEDMQYMFWGCENFKQDLSGWDVSNVERHNFMFDKCPIKLEYEPDFIK